MVFFDYQQTLCCDEGTELGSTTVTFTVKGGPVAFPSLALITTSNGPVKLAKGVNVFRFVPDTT